LSSGCWGILDDIWAAISGTLLGTFLGTISLAVLVTILRIILWSISVLLQGQFQRQYFNICQ
jgi:hypothetical protein